MQSKDFIGKPNKRTTFYPIIYETTSNANGEVYFTLSVNCLNDSPEMFVRAIDCMFFSEH